MSDQPEMDNQAEGEFESPFEEFLYHQRRALEETGKALESLLPEGFRTHGSNASKEFTKGFRVLVDAAVDEMRKASSKHTSEEDAGDEGEDDTPPSSTGKTKVKVEVD